MMPCRDVVAAGVARDVCQKPVTLPAGRLLQRIAGSRKRGDVAVFGDERDAARARRRGHELEVRVGFGPAQSMVQVGGDQAPGVPGTQLVEHSQQEHRIAAARCGNDATAAVGEERLAAEEVINIAQERVHAGPRLPRAPPFAPVEKQGPGGRRPGARRPMNRPSPPGRQKTRQSCLPSPFRFLKSSFSFAGRRVPFRVSMAERILVLGSNSFSGASFVEYALACGATVFGASRSPEPAVEFLPYRWRTDRVAEERFEFRQLDLNHDPDRILQAVEAFRPDYVVNFAAQSMVAESWLYPEHWYQTNVVANVRLHDGLRRFDFLRKYVHVSTPEVYGSCSGDVAEDAPINPSTPYAASRAACDLHLMTFFRNYQFPVVLTRAANVFGPGQQLYRIIPRTILFILTGRKLQLHGGGRSVRSFIHIRDVADGTLRVAREGTPGEVYHLATRVTHSIREVVETVCRKLGARFEEVVDVVGDRPGKDAAYLLDSAKARRALGWSDTISFEQGLDETMAWVKHNLSALRNQPTDYVHKP